MTAYITEVIQHAKWKEVIIEDHGMSYAYNETEIPGLLDMGIEIANVGLLGESA